jgi:DEAD/DEAH box helicase
VPGFKSVRPIDFVYLDDNRLMGCRVTYLVLDEADRMLDQGFENDIRRIIERTVDGSERQTVMCALYPIAASHIVMVNGSFSQRHLA